MKHICLSEIELNQIFTVFQRTPSIKKVVLFGSRAKGNFHKESDIDLAITGLENDLQAEAVAEELDELPLPYTFDVKALEQVQHQPLREHIERADITLYRQEMEAVR